MQPKSNAKHAASADLEAFFRDGYLPVYGHATSVAELVLERLPSGEHEWLRPSTDTCEGDDALYTITDAGRRALAQERLFGPWLTVAEAYG